MKYRDTENGKIWDGIDLLAEYIENAAEIEESSGARNFSEWLLNATSKNGFLEKLNPICENCNRLGKSCNGTAEQVYKEQKTMKTIKKYTLESLMCAAPLVWLVWAAAVIPQAGIFDILAVFVGLGITLAAEQFLSGILWDCLTEREKEEITK